MKELLKNRTFLTALAASVFIHAVVLTVKTLTSVSFRTTTPPESFELVIERAPGSKIEMPDFSAVTAQQQGAGDEFENVAVAPKQVPAVTAPQPSQTRETAPSTRSSGYAPEAARQPGPATRSEVVSSNAKGGATGTPKRTVVTAATKDLSRALYYKALRRRVEHMGLINFPQKNGRRLYGELTVRIPVAADGRIYEGEGGPGIERSSGNRDLDAAALSIVRRSAPFGPLPKSGSADVWIVITRLKFTREH